MKQDEADKRAEAVIEAMQGGPICDVSPERSRAIIAAALKQAADEEREACEAIVAEGKSTHWCENFGDLRADLAAQIRARGAS